MKVSIIGGGWLGCHIASKLKLENHNIALYEKSDIFAGSSFYNQNRLHKGFHYSRSEQTRRLCYSTFELFLNDYKHLVEDIPNNYYVVPENKSLIDFGTFKNIFSYENVQYKEDRLEVLSHIEGSVLVDEMYINPIKTREHFKSILEHDVIIKEVSIKDLEVISKESDLVVNVTNNALQPLPNHYFELSLTLVYTKKVKDTFGSITMVDGPFFSIYPLSGNKYTVTDVEHTPIFTSNSLKHINKFKATVSTKSVDVIRHKIEEKILYYYKTFKDEFTYSTYYTSVKVKKISESADRSPTIVQKGNTITCVTGKIQGIYTLENYINNEVINR